MQGMVNKTPINAKMFSMKKKMQKQKRPFQVIITITTSAYKDESMLKLKSQKCPPVKKTGPEEAQYFHVRPPIGFIKMGYKTQEE